MNNTQSILTLNREAYLEKAEENLLRLSDAYFYENKFKIGKGADRDKVSFYMQNYRYLSTDNCEINNYIQDKIEGKLEECGKKPKTKQTIHEILKLAKQYLETQDCTLDEAISCTVSWDSVEW